MESIKVVFLCIASAVFYGILYDQITARVSIEYFTFGYPPSFRTDFPTLLAFGWGIIATWWGGLILGLPAAGLARLGRAPKIPASRLVKPIGYLLGVVAIAAFAAGLAGYLAAISGRVKPAQPLWSLMQWKKHAAFLSHLWAHTASCTTGILGALFLYGWIWRQRVLLRRKADAPPADAPVPARCDVCGLESSLESAFHRVQIFRRRGKVYCPSCWHQRTTTNYRRYLIAGLLAGLLGLLVHRLAPGQPLGEMLLVFCLVLVFEILCVIPHELGHALAALLFRMRLFGVSIGLLGKVLINVQIGGYDVFVRSIPLGGCTLVTPKNTHFVRLKYFVVLLCGPLANGALLAAAWFLRQRTSYSELGELAWYMFMLSNLIVLAVNLWPWTISVGALKLSSDGLALLKVFFKSDQEIREWHAMTFYLEGMESRERKKPEEARNWFEQGLAEYPNEWINYLGLGMLLLDLDQYAEARETFQRTLGLSSLKPEVEPIIWNNIAWTDVLLGSPEWRDEADRFSRQAIEHLPWVPAIKGTRGSVLVEKGDVAQGIKLLKEALSENEAAAHQALNACYLAIATARQGQPDEARQYLEEARRLDPDCPLLNRALEQVQTIAMAPAQAMASVLEENKW